MCSLELKSSLFEGNQTVMLKPTVSIDLGASYTKVAYRGPLSRSGGMKFATCDTAAVVVEGAATIPSVVVYSGDRRRPWVIGADAAKLTPGAGMKVFENWKSALYSSAFDAGKVKLVTVAGEFFKWLHQGLVAVGLDAQDSWRVRVTIPALQRIEDQKDALIECMSLSGWPDDIEVVQEPVANMIGVLSGGRNVVSAHGKISYKPTFGESHSDGLAQLNYVFGEMRRHALGHRKERYMRLCVVDFGSFTLDFASLELDLNVIDYDAFPVASLSPESWEIGVIEHIDSPCFSELFRRNGIDSRQLSFGVKESAKRAIYAGQPYALAYAGGRATLCGSEEDRRIVEGAIRQYCRDGWSRIESLCQDAEVVVLTGGGASISGIRQYFSNNLVRLGVSSVVDFADEDRGEDARGIKDGLQDWGVVGDGLGRLATGLGGASIALGFERDDFCRRYVAPGVGM